MDFWRLLLIFQSRDFEVPPLPLHRQNPELWVVGCGEDSGDYEPPAFSRAGSAFCKTTVNSSTLKLARDNYSTVLRAMGVLTQAEVAARMGVNPSTLSRLKSNGDHEQACLVLAACGVEIPSENRQLYDKAFVESLQFIAAANLNKSKS
jgi:DNA-binding XRE family transcriptional regulator